MKVVIADVRIAFPVIFEPKLKVGNKKARYSAAFVIVPGSANAKALAAAVLQVATEKWRDKATAVLAKLREDKKLCYVEGPLRDKDGDVYDGFEGMFALNSGQDEDKGRVTVLGRTKEVLVAKDGKPYGGSYVNAILDIWAQDHPEHGRRISAQLKGVQFVRDGDAFGGGAPANPDEFEDLGVPAEEETV